MTETITKSLEAIKGYNPKEGLYLQVVGYGIGQHLAVVKKTWFGRLLMWLGLASACMKRVALYVAVHIHLLSQNANNDGAITLKTLANRIASYDNERSNKIYGLVYKIKQALLHAVSTVLSNPPQNTAQVNPVPIPNPVPITIPTPALLPVPPTTPAVSQAANSKPDEAAEKQKKWDILYQKLGQCGHDEARFKALIEGISLTEINTHTPARGMMGDLWDLTADRNYRIKPGFVVKHMSKMKLRALIRGYFVSKWEDGICDSFVRFVSDIIALRSPREQAFLIDQIVQQDFFSIRFMTQKENPLQKALKSRYLLHLLRKVPSGFRDAKLKEFFNKVWPGKISNPTTFFHDPSFQQLLTLDEKGAIARVLISGFDRCSWENLNMYQELMNTPKWGKDFLRHPDTIFKLEFLLSVSTNNAVLKEATEDFIDDPYFWRIHFKLLKQSKIDEVFFKEIIEQALAYFKNAYPALSDKDRLQKAVNYLSYLHDLSKEFVPFLMKNYKIDDIRSIKWIDNLLFGGSMYLSCFMALNHNIAKTKLFAAKYSKSQLSYIRYSLRQKTDYSATCLACIDRRIEALEE